MLTKTKVKEHLKDFPEEFSLDQLVEKLIFIEKLEERIKESEDGKTLTEEEFNAETSQWLK
jgi:hypothetical protein